MRQAGILAAAGLYALEHNVARLAEDHANAERLARGLAGAGLEVEPVQTNMVFVKVAKERCAALQAHLEAAGVVAIVSPRTRLVTHLDVDRGRSPGTPPGRGRARRDAAMLAAWVSKPGRRILRCQRPSPPTGCRRWIGRPTAASAPAFVPRTRCEAPCPAPRGSKCSRCGRTWPPSWPAAAPACTGSCSAGSGSRPPRGPPKSPPRSTRGARCRRCSRAA